jgi:hypothetical protein
MKSTGYKELRDRIFFIRPLQFGQSDYVRFEKVSISTCSFRMSVCPPVTQTLSH